MSQCPKCQKPLGCSCQLRTASNGTTCCSSCIHSYEAELRRIAANQQSIVPAPPEMTPFSNPNNNE